MLRILCIGGSNHRPNTDYAFWTHLRLAFKTHIPQAYVVLTHDHFRPWQAAQMHGFALSTAAMYDDGTPTILIGYSLGGFIALQVASSLQRTPVIGVATISTPHALAWLWSFPLKRSCNYPFISFVALLDLVVPFFLSYVPGHSSLLLATHRQRSHKPTLAIRRIASKISSFCSHAARGQHAKIF